MRLYLQQFLSVYILVLPALLPQGVPATVIINDSSELPLQSYDYIVVGGGTTGLAVANRLAVEYSVLVVERGPDLVDNEDINNPFTTYGTPSPCRFSMEGAPQIGSNGVKPMRLTYGSCLGGGSSINGLMGARPTFAGMNAVEALGNPGWGWNNFLPYMQKSETFTPPDPIQITEGADYIASVHGFSGPVGVSFAQPLVAPKMQGAAKSTVKSVFDDAVTLTPDMGDGFSGGHVASLYHHIHFNQTLQSDQRSSSAWSYLYPELQQRVGLAVLTGHRVNSLVTLKSASGNVTAVGVRVQPTSGGQIFTLDVSKEVVVTAGALYSPAILQRSGIGNSTYLKGLGITPVLDLPGVGANFQDQPYLVNVSFPLAPFNNITSITGGADTLVGVVVAHLTARNALGSEGATKMNSLIRNISADKALSVGGVVQSQTLITQARLTADAYEIDHPIVEFFFNPTLTVLQVWAQSILPLSRGFIRINTTDPSEDPIADAQYLTQDVDVQIMVAAARVVSKIASSPPFSNLLSPNALADSGVPGVNATDDQVKQWVLSTYTAGIHFVGSNAMMPKDLGGVVSPELLVYGTSNIRIADASVIPLSVFPHTTLGLYGVAEKAAEVIVQRAKDEAHSI